MDIPMTSTKTEDRNQVTRHVIAATPASPSSSPSHDFSFTISLHNHPSILLPFDRSKTVSSQTQSVSSLAMVDLTPADDIFFHGHLLPLHRLSSLPASPPRLSTNSLDSFTLPITDFLEEAKPNNTIDQRQNQNQNQKQKQKQQNQNQSRSQNNSFYIKNTESKGKSKSFSMLGLKRWRSKGLDEPEKPKRKLPISDVSHFISRMVKPLMFFKGTKMMSNREDLQHQSNGPPRGQYSKSLSGNLASRQSGDRSRDVRGGSGEFSAPASMRISPSNSGLLAAKAGMSPPVSDSTMEELQAAIQAAIAHCKNSIAVDQDEKKHKSEPTT